MTPSEIEEAARNRYNAIGDSFWSQDEIFMLIYDASLQMAVETDCIEAVLTTSTVIDQREYTYPPNVYKIKRIEYNDYKLDPITFRENDYMLGYTTTVDASGSPQYYSIFDDTIYLQPIPSAVDDLRIFGYVEPSTVTATTTLEIPAKYHMDLVNYVVSEMCAKDQNYTGAQRFERKWLAAINKCKRDVRKKKRGDSFASVQLEEMP